MTPTAVVIPAQARHILETTGAVIGAILSYVVETERGFRRTQNRIERYTARF